MNLNMYKFLNEKNKNYEKILNRPKINENLLHIDIDTKM